MLHRAISASRRFLRLKPMHSVFRELRRRDIRVDECRALEVFGGNGGRPVATGIDFATMVARALGAALAGLMAPGALRRRLAALIDRVRFVLAEAEAG